MLPYWFAPATPNEDIVYGAYRPGYDSSKPEISVEDWISFMQDRGIERICCLLDNALEQYDDLLGSFRQAFGADKVAHVPINDYTRIQTQEYRERVLPFLEEADATDEPVVVHCSAGSGRTGHVLVLWLVCGREYTLDDAIETIERLGRQPLESTHREALIEVLEACQA